LDERAFCSERLPDVNERFEADETNRPTAARDGDTLARLHNGFANCALEIEVCDQNPGLVRGDDLPVRVGKELVTRGNAEIANISGRNSDEPADAAGRSAAEAAASDRLARENGRRKWH